MCEPEMEESIEQANLKLLESGDFSDVTFVIGPTKEKFKAHKLILASRSRVFSRMFEDTWEWEESSKCEVTIRDTNVTAFQSFLEFMYADKFDKTKEIVEIKHLIALADEYDVSGLLHECDDYILRSKFDLKTCVAELYELTSFYNREKIKTHIEREVARNFMEFSTSAEFLKMDEKFMPRLLIRNDLNIEEVGLFQALLRWDESRLGNSGKSRRSVLKKLLPHIRFPLMTLEQLSSIVRPTKLIPAEELLDIIAYKIATTDDEKQRLGQSLNYSLTPRHPRGSLGADANFTPAIPTEPARHHSRSRYSSKKYCVNVSGKRSSGWVVNINSRHGSRAVASRGHPSG